MTETKRVFWDRFADCFVDTADLISLFETIAGGIVDTIAYGRSDRRTLHHGERMERQLRETDGRVVIDYDRREDCYEGLVYMMYTLDGDEIVPRYLGRCGKFGVSGTDLNSSLQNVDTSDGKFARWGYGNYYHLGNLSPAIFRDDGPGKYDHWVVVLLVSTNPPWLREPVYLWVES